MPLPLCSQVYLLETCFSSHFALHIYHVSVNCEKINALLNTVMFFKILYFLCPCYRI